MPVVRQALAGMRSPPLHGLSFLCFIENWQWNLEEKIFLLSCREKVKIQCRRIKKTIGKVFLPIVARSFRTFLLSRGWQVKTGALCTTFAFLQTGRTLSPRSAARFSKRLRLWFVFSVVPRDRISFTKVRYAQFSAIVVEGGSQRLVIFLVRKFPSLW